MHRQLLAMVGALVVSCSVQANESEGYFDDFPVVLSASRLKQTADEAPATVTVIDREMIRASGAREIVDLFRLVPGMVVGQTQDHRPTLGFHGFSDPFFRQMQVLVDGVSIYSAAWGGAEWSELPIALEDVDRIEVVHGPNAATFGANSFVGVVNIITRDPALEHRAELVANHGENGIRDTHMRYAVNEGDLRYRVTIGQRADHGLDSYPDSRRTNFFNLRGHYRMNATDELRLQTAYSGGTQGSGVYPDPDEESTAGPRKANFDSGSLQLRWTRVRGADEEIWLQFSHSQRSFRDELPYVLDLFGQWDYPISYSFDRRRTDLEMQHTLRVADDVRGVWGGQVRVDGARSEAYFSSSDWETSGLYRLFGNIEWRPADRWIVAGGAMLEKNTLTGTSLSPSIAINHEFLPDHTLRLRYSKARRTPTLYEAEADWGYALPSGLKVVLEGMGPPFASMASMPIAKLLYTQQDLKEERIKSSEISYLGRIPAYRINVEAHVFEHRLDDLIGIDHYPFPATVRATLDPDEHLYVRGFANLNTARVVGRTGVFRWEPWLGTQIYLTGSRTKIRANGPDEEALEASGPRHTVSMLFSQAFPGGFNFSCGYYRVGAMRSLSGGDPLSATEKVDLRLARTFHLGSTRGDIALVVQRANGREPVYRSEDMDKRTTWLNMRIEY